MHVRGSVLPTPLLSDGWLINYVAGTLLIGSSMWLRHTVHGPTSDK